MKEYSGLQINPYILGSIFPRETYVSIDIFLTNIKKKL